MSDRTKIADTALPERDCGKDNLWPLTVTRIAVSGLATIANGGTQQNLPKHVGALMILGVNSGVVFGATGGDGDQYLPVFHGAIFPMDGKTYWLATQAATGDGTAFVAGFESVDRALEWKQLLGHVPPQQGAAAPITVDITELPAPAVLADNTANPTISKIQTFPMGWDSATWDRLTATVSAGKLDVSVHAQGSGVGLDGAWSDGGTVSGINIMRVEAFPVGFNGTTADRLRMSGFQAAQDNLTVPTLGLAHVLAFGEVLNNRTVAAERLRQPDAYADASAEATGADSSTTGAKLTVTCPAGTSIRIRRATAFHKTTVGAVVVDLILTPSGGAATVLERWSLALGTFPAAPRQDDICLTAGDTIEWNVTGAGALTTMDFTIAYEQTRYPI